MNRIIWFILLLFVINGFAAFGSEPAEVIWWELKSLDIFSMMTSGTSRTSPPGHPGAASDASKMSHPGHPGAATDASKMSHPGHPGAATDASGMSRPKHPGVAPAASEMSRSKRPSRSEIIAIMRRPKKLELRWGKFPSAGKSESILSQSVAISNADGWLRSPGGDILNADLHTKGNTIMLQCPSEKDPTQYSGLYVVGVHLDAGVMDFDADGIKERVHLYSNRLVYYSNRNNERGENPAVLFNDAEKMALEIGPSDPDFKNGPYSVMNQRALDEHRMQVLYKGSPLANTEVSVFTENGWKKTITTDSQGIMSIIPLKNKLKNENSPMSRGEKYLYVALHKEPLAGEYDGVQYASEYHCASLLMDVRMPPPEWKSRVKGFNLLSISGMGLFIGVATLGIYRKKKLDKETMVKFDEHRIRKD